MKYELTKTLFDGIVEGNIYERADNVYGARWLMNGEPLAPWLALFFEDEIQQPFSRLTPIAPKLDVVAENGEAPVAEEKAE